MPSPVASLRVSVKVGQTQPKRYALPPITDVQVLVDYDFVDGVSARLTNPYSTAIPDTASLYAVLYDASGQIVGGGADQTGAAIARPTRR